MTKQEKQKKPTPIKAFENEVREATDREFDLQTGIVKLDQMFAREARRDLSFPALRDTIGGVHDASVVLCGQAIANALDNDGKIGVVVMCTDWKMSEVLSWIVAPVVGVAVDEFARGTVADLQLSAAQAWLEKHEKRFAFVDVDDARFFDDETGPTSGKIQLIDEAVATLSGCDHVVALVVDPNSMLSGNAEVAEVAAKNARRDWRRLQRAARGINQWVRVEMNVEAHRLDDALERVDVYPAGAGTSIRLLCRTQAPNGQTTNESHMIDATFDGVRWAEKIEKKVTQEVVEGLDGVPVVVGESVEIVSAGEVTMPEEWPDESRADCPDAAPVDAGVACDDPAPASAKVEALPSASEF